MVRALKPRRSQISRKISGAAPSTSRGTFRPAILHGQPTVHRPANEPEPFFPRVSADGAPRFMSDLQPVLRLAERKLLRKFYKNQRASRRRRSLKLSRIKPTGTVGERTGKLTSEVHCGRAGWLMPFSGAAYNATRKTRAFRLASDKFYRSQCSLQYFRFRGHRIVVARTTSTGAEFRTGDAKIADRKLPVAVRDSRAPCAK